MTSATPKGLKVHDDRVYDPKKKKTLSKCRTYQVYNQVVAS